MFKVQNLRPGYYALDLEKSEKGKGRSISIPPGGYLDLDKYCSRAWISSDLGLKKALKKDLRLVHDSEIGIPSQTINTAVKVPDMPLPKPKDLKRIPEIPTHIDPPEVIDLGASREDDIKEEKKVIEDYAEELLPEDPVEDPIEAAIENNEDLKSLLEEKPKRRRGRQKQKKEDEDKE